MAEREGRHAIGVSSDPVQRAARLRATLLATVPCVGRYGYGLECRVHQHYAERRLDGEWFRLTPTQVAMFGETVMPLVNRGGRPGRPALPEAVKRQHERDRKRRRRDGPRPPSAPGPPP